MADLFNLLDGLTEETQAPSLSPAASEDNDAEIEELQRDDDDRPQPSVPLALRELERKQQEFVEFEKETTSKGLRVDYEEEEEEEDTFAEDPDYTQLKRLWTQEMTCPELLPYDGDTTELQLELLQGQEESIDKLQSSTASTSDSSSNLNSLVASIYKMDADRVRFMATDLQRTRLAKMEEHPLYMREMLDRMSKNEVAYLRQYGELLESHFRRTVLDHMPKDAWKKLDEPEMIDAPDLDQFVFCKVLETVVINKYDPLGQHDDDDEEEADKGDIQEQGAVLIARYSTIRELVLQGKIELLL